MPEPERTICVDNFPVLSNTGKQLSLISEFNDTIHTVTYSDTWYKSSSKKTGGYSLEMIDIDDFGAGSDNWSASNDISGGTPGYENSFISETEHNEYDITKDSLNTGIWIVNNKLSLNTSLQESNLILGYRFSEENYTLSVFMFNKQGKRVAELANKEILQTEGALTYTDE